MGYTSLEQRMAQGYLDLFPPFIPDKNAAVTIAEQEFFYGLMRGLYQLAFDEPSRFVASLHEDDAYPSRYKTPYGKPNLVVVMRKFTKAVDALLQKMFLLGQGEDIALDRRQQAVFLALGIADSRRLPAAWAWMSTRKGANITRFSHCFFDDDYPYPSDIYARLLGEASFKKLESWMLSKGYERVTIHDITASDCKLSLTIANPKWSDKPPAGGFEYKIRHTGIAAQHDFYVRNPVVFGLCIPNGMKQCLENFGLMENELQRFVMERTKQCDHCRYCVQTDKTGARPLGYIPIEFEGEIANLCPYFPGYNYSWTSIDDALANKLILMLSFMDTFVPGNGRGVRIGS